MGSFFSEPLHFGIDDSTTPILFLRRTFEVSDGRWGPFAVLTGWAPWLVYLR